MYTSTSPIPTTLITQTDIDDIKSARRLYSFLANLSLMFERLVSSNLSDYPMHRLEIDFLVRSLNRGTRGEKIGRSTEKNLHVRSYSFFDNNPRSMAVPGDPDSFRALYSDAYTRRVKCDRLQWHKTL